MLMRYGITIQRLENIDIKEERNPNFVVSSIDEVKKRINEEEFEKEMDKFVETL